MRIEVGYVLRPHGVRGELRLKLHNPESTVLEDVDTVWIAGTPHRVVSVLAQPDGWLVKLAGVVDRDGSDALKGKTVEVAREAVVVEEGEYLLADLVGCEVVDQTVGPLGRVTALASGQHDMMVVRDDRVERLVPIVDELIVEVDTAARRVTVALPEEWPEEPNLTMQFEVVTLFPELFGSFLDASLLGKARASGKLSVHFTDPRDFTTDKHRTVDDTPYGGGVGMVMKVEPVVAAIESAVAARGPAHRILMTPGGRRLTQARVRELAALPRVLLVCGRYEGVDARVSALAIDEELSIGDFVLAGGEVAAMVVIEAVSRFVPGVLGDALSTTEESFTEPLLEYPQYTRPPEFRGLPVPEILLSGNHERIRTWRRDQAVERTRAVRPDLLEKK